jgi:hypothetical protein
MREVLNKRELLKHCRMYIPLWVIIVAAAAVYLLLSARRSGSESSSLSRIERDVTRLKANIFSDAHFESPHFIDLQDSFDSMEVNYLRLKQQFSHDDQKSLEIARDWKKYVASLFDLRSARILLDVDMGDDALESAEERFKEPSIIKEEVEKKFKTLLGDAWCSPPPDYFERMETMAAPETGTGLRGSRDSWRYYYAGSENLRRADKKRSNQERTSN